jgi:DUF1680 family protein
MHDRFELTLKRVLSGNSPAYSEEFILADLRPTPGRRFTEYSGDISGRYIGALATAAQVYQTSFPDLDSLVAKAILLQKPEGYFGSEFHFEKPTDLDMALLWGNGRLLVGLLEYYRLHQSAAVLETCRRLGDFLVKVGPLMLSQEIRNEFGAQHFASSYICWTQQVEGLANLYQLTGDSRYRKLGEDIIAVTERRPGDHVHGYLTSIRGWVDLYKATSDPVLLQKCEAAWQDVAESKDLLITSGVPEGWSPNNHRTEGCAEADWLRLSLALWNATGKPKYLEMAERTLFNEFAFNQFATGDFGHRVYSETGLPGAGAVRAWWCCTLHGLRAFPDIQSTAFRREPDGLSFDLPLDSTVESKALSAEARSTLALDGTVTISILSEGKARLSIRKPEWSSAIAVKINNQPAESPLVDGYLQLLRQWKPGDTVAVQYSMTLRKEPAGNGRVAYFYGPWLLGAGAHDNPEYFNELTADNRLGERSGPVDGGAGAFSYPRAASAFRYTPAEYPEQPATVTLRAIAEQTGQTSTSWELRFLT